MKTFRNYIEAEHEAENQARNQVNNPECLAFVFIRARKAGDPYTEKEKAEAKAIRTDAMRRIKQRLLTEWITQGWIRDCRMARRFMETGYVTWS